MVPRSTRPCGTMWAMPLAVDTSRALRTYDELTQLANAILQAPTTEQETDSVEWKSRWDLNEAKTRFETARHILGFGNRTVAAAGQTFDGCAYLIAGVEPGSLVGVGMTDVAEIHDRIAKYISPGEPRWSAQYVRLDGRSVLVVTVESPKAGDPIFTLQRTFESCAEGRIFVRRHGKTEEANPADVRALEARTKAARPRVALLVQRGDEGATLRALRAAVDAEEWLGSERTRLLAPLAPRPRRPRTALDLFAVPDVSSSYLQLSQERRSQETFIQEVEEYLESAERRWAATMAALGITNQLARVRLQVVNPTERNFDGVEVVVEVDGEAGLWFSAEEPFDAVSAPDPPDPWGTQTLLDLTAAVPRLHYPFAATTTTDEIERAGGVQRARFGSRHVRPGAVVPLPSIFLTLPVERAGGAVAVSWHLTSTSVDGSQSGELSYEVDEVPADLIVPPGSVDVLED